MPSIIILRGLPGSGKSTLAAELSEQGRYPVCCIDDYFVDEKGEYNFEHTKNHLAYKACEEKVRKYAEERAGKIFVDNVFSMEWEMEPYFKIASEFNYRIFVVTVENRHGGKNIHAVSNEQLKKMAEKFKVVLL